MTALAIEPESAIATPTHFTPRRPERPTDGPLVAMIADALGMPLLQWQKDVADVMMEYDPETKRYYYGTTVLSVPRRGGKTAMIIAMMILRMMRQKHQRISYSAQLGKDSLELLRDLDERLQDNRMFSGKFVPRYAAGTENLRMPLTKGLIRFLAPGRRTGHGRDNDMVIFDEAWGIDPEVGRQIEVGLLPTMATRPNPQVIITSAAGDLRSTWWDSWRQKGITAVETGADRGLAFFEWQAGPEDIWDDPTVWHRIHPGVAEGLISDAFLQDQLNVMTPEDFTRAYLNRPVVNIQAVLTTPILRKCRTTENIPSDAQVVFGFDVSIDRAEASIFAAARGPSGKVLIELIDNRPGTFWLQQRIEELIARHNPSAVVMEKSGPALPTAQALERGGAKIHQLTTRDYAAACAVVYDGMVQKEPYIFHRGESAFMAAAGSAVKRNTGDTWVWGRRASAGSISALVAATCAVWGLDAPKIEKVPEPGIW